MGPVSDRTAILLIAHGSRHQAANDDLHELAARVAARGDYPIVEACFLELAEPDIATGGSRCVARGATRVLMIPYFLSAGVHLLRDLTAARDELEPASSGDRIPAWAAAGPAPLARRPGGRADRRAGSRRAVAGVIVSSDEMHKTLRAAGRSRAERRDQSGRYRKWRSGDLH